jgi:hypothetical protein
MTEEERIEYTKLRIESAQNTFEAAKILAQNGFWNSIVNIPVFIYSHFEYHYYG